MIVPKVTHNYVQHIIDKFRQQTVTPQTLGIHVPEKRFKLEQKVRHCNPADSLCSGIKESIPRGTFVEWTMVTKQLQKSRWNTILEY
jgi:hypothetical protein